MSVVDSFENGSMLAYMTSSQLHVAAVCPDHTPPLIITYDTRDNTHTLWAVQPATSRVRESHNVEYKFICLGYSFPWFDPRSRWNYDFNNCSYSRGPPQ